LFLPSEEQHPEEDPLLRFQRRMLREYSPQETLPEEDRLARSALQMGLEEKNPQGRLTASLTTVGAEFDQDQPYGLERGTRRTGLAGQYALRPNLSVGTEYTRVAREALAQRAASVEESWRNQMQFQPSDTSAVEVTHERTQAQEGNQPARLQETVKITGEQELGEKAKLMLEQEQERKRDEGGEQRQTETEARLKWEPSRRVDVDLKQKREQTDQKTPETTHEFEVRYKPDAPLSVKASYTQEDKGNRQQQEREVELEARPGDDLKITTGFEQEHKRGERFDTHSLKIEATPGKHTKLKAGYEEEEKSRGNLERTQTAEWELQPMARLSVSGRYRETDERRGTEEVSWALAVTNRATDWLTVTGAEEAEWKEGLRTERMRRMGAEGAFGGGLSLTMSQEWREKEAEAWEIRSAGATYRPSETIQLSGRQTTRTDVAHRVIRSRQANVDVRPLGGLHLLGSLTENPEDATGRVLPGWQLQAQMAYEVTSGLSLSGRTARHEDDLRRLQRQEAELGLSLGSDTGRLFTQVRMEETLSLGRQFNTEYRLGYSRNLGSRLSWSLEGVLQRHEDWYGPVGGREEEYRGEAKINLSF
jgi:hypothetical protein